MTTQDNFPSELTLNEVMNNDGYEWDCKLHRLRSNPMLRLANTRSVNGQKVPFYSDVYMDMVEGNHL